MRTKVLPRRMLPRFAQLRPEYQAPESVTDIALAGQ